MAICRIFFPGYDLVMEPFLLSFFSKSVNAGSLFSFCFSSQFLGGKEFSGRPSLLTVFSPEADLIVMCQFLCHFWRLEYFGKLTIEHLNSAALLFDFLSWRSVRKEIYI